MGEGMNVWGQEAKEAFSLPCPQVCHEPNSASSPFFKKIKKMFF